MKCRMCRERPEYIKKMSIVFSEADESDNSAFNFILCDRCYKKVLEQFRWIYGEYDIGT